MDRPRARKHRLSREDYVGQVRVAFTCCVDERRKLFVERDIVNEFVEILKVQCHRHELIIPIYCFMPDHLHVITVGRSYRSDAKSAFDGFKKKSGELLCAKNLSESMQFSYHDHVIRASHDWRNQVFYILQNPKRAGLVNDVWDYPYTGSIGCDLKEMVLDTAWWG